MQAQEVNMGSWQAPDPALVRAFNAALPLPQGVDQGRLPKAPKAAAATLARVGATAGEARP